MKQLNSFKKKVFNSKVPDFSSQALSLFKFQSENNSIYRKYIELMGVTPSKIKTMEQIPFMPIEFFKQHDIKTTEWEEECVFMSSGTMANIRSRHLVEDLEFYRRHSLNLFCKKFGDIRKDIVFGLLPSYSEHGNSSLICMVDHIMRQADRSGYYLHNFEELEDGIRTGLSSSGRVFLFGVGYALLDFARSLKEPLNGLVVIETGGMKGRREELVKDEFYQVLKSSLGDIGLYSEYGMSELFSQAYSKEEYFLECPQPMKVLIRDMHDPFSFLGHNQSGGINVIDLANVHSCAFIETMDVGRTYQNGTFEVLGRVDNSDLRGCNLLVQ